MKSAPRFREWVIELQRLLWLYNPILHRQALLAVVADEFRVWLGGYGYAVRLPSAVSALSSHPTAPLSSPHQPECLPYHQASSVFDL